MKKGLLIIGTGSHGKKVCAAAIASGIEVTGFFDENANNNGPIHGFEVFHSLEGLVPGLFIVAIGDALVRKRLHEKFIGLEWGAATVIHPGAHISKYARIGHGSIVFAGAVIEVNSTIGTSCIINIGSLVDHDTEVGDFCHLKPGSIMEPYSKIVSCSIIGAGEIVKAK